MFLQRIRNVIACSLVALGVSASPALATPLQTPPGSKIEVHVACTPLGGSGQGKVDHDHQVTIKVKDPNGVTHTVSGEIHRSGTAGALCRDLQASLEAAGADATQISYGPKDPTEQDPKEREATYILELPPGWTAESSTTVQKKVGVENGVPKWRTCSEHSHLSVRVLASTLSGGFGNVTYVGTGQSHPFPVVVALELRRANPDATEPTVLFSGEYSSAAGGPGALLDLASALQAAGFSVSAAADASTQTQGLVVIDSSGQPFADVAFVASFGEGEDETAGDNDAAPDSDDTPEPSTEVEEWVEIRSVSVIF